MKQRIACIRRWHQLDHMQIICTLLETDNHASTSSLNIYMLDAFPDTQPSVSKHWRQYYQMSLINFFHLLWFVAFCLFSFLVQQSFYHNLSALPWVLHLPLCNLCTSSSYCNTDDKSSAWQQCWSCHSCHAGSTGGCGLDMPHKRFSNDPWRYRWKGEVLYRIVVVR